MDQTNQKKSPLISGLIIGVVSIIFLLGVFQLGIMVGSHKARFNCDWGERYGTMLGMPFQGQGRFGQPPPPGMLDPNGAFGSVVSNNGQQLVMKSKDGAEKTIVITPTTEIRKGRDTVKATDITDKDEVVVFGSPTSTGQIEAKLIRVFDVLERGQK
ncbi:MAG: hypothetical protein PHC53_04370 [Patescibacteria group bacterium]|nr:hypothetical protein [Patescibacteria group bacterium]